MNCTACKRPLHQRGLGLIEALITLLVLTIGALTAARLQADLRLHADTARERSVAVRLAQQDLETLRGFATLGSTPGAPAYDDIASIAALPGIPAPYSLERQISALPGDGAKRARVRVVWRDRSGAPQQVELRTLIAASDPLYSGALDLPQQP